VKSLNRKQGRQGCRQREQHRQRTWLAAWMRPLQRTRAETGDRLQLWLRENLLHRQWPFTSSCP
jgi:hypothetical protein